MPAVLSLSDHERAKWLAEHLSTRGFPAVPVHLGDGWSVALELMVNYQHHSLHLRLEDGVVLWQLLHAEGGQVVLAGTWATTPGRVGQRVKSMLAALGAAVRPNADTPPRGYGVPWSVGGPTSAGHSLYLALKAEGASPSMGYHDGVPTLTVRMESGAVRITSRKGTLAHPVSDHPGWEAVLQHAGRAEPDQPGVRIYLGSREHGPQTDTSRCAAAVGALLALVRHRRTTTVGARIRAAAEEEGITAWPEDDHDALVVPLADGGELWICDQDGETSYQPEDCYTGAEIWHHPEDPRDGRGKGRRILATVGGGNRGLAGLRADLPVLLDTLKRAVEKAGGQRPG